MITRFNIKKEIPRLEVFQLIQKRNDFDFYYTKDNERRYINTHQDLKALMKNCIAAWMLKDVDVKGFAVIWMSKVGDMTRPYVKLIAENPMIAEQLLDVISWNYKKELYVKLHRKNWFLKCFYRKGYKFQSGRGSQILLHKKVFIKDKNYGTSHNKYHNKS